MNSIIQSPKNPVFYSGDVMCGGGKTQTALRTLAQRFVSLIQSGKELPTVVISSKSNNLSHQTLSDLTRMANELDNSIALPVTLITSDVAKASGTRVTKMMNEHLTVNNRTKGIVLCSHAALGLMPSDTFSDLEIIIDEVPDGDLAGIISCSFSDNFTVDVLEDCLTYTPLRANVYSVKIKEGKARELRNHLYMARTNNSGFSEDFHKVFAYLVEKPDNEILYRRHDITDYSTQDENGELTACSEHIYEAVESLRLTSLVDVASKVTFLAASFKSSLVHYILTFCKGYELKVDTELVGTLRAKHKTKLRILPLVQGANWSRYLRESLAKDKIENFEREDDSLTVEHYLIERVMNHFGSDFLFFLNSAPKSFVERTFNLPIRNVTSMTNAAHGINGLTDYTKAAFMVAANPSPFEINILKQFAENYEMEGDTIALTAKAERSLEACYQCIARMAFRNADYDGECIAIVPDIQHAKYVMTKFEDGCCTIDESFASVIKTTEYTLSEDVRMAKHVEAANKAVAYFTDVTNKPKGVKVSDIQANHGISKRTAVNWKKKFIAELKSKGLVK